MMKRGRRPRSRSFGTLTNQKGDGDTILPWDKCQELVIVPQGPLWYMPFEAVPIKGDGGTDEPLLAKAARWTWPLISLALPDKRPMRPDMETLVVGGKLHPKDADDASDQGTTGSW